MVLWCLFCHLGDLLCHSLILLNRALSAFCVYAAGTWALSRDLTVKCASSVCLPNFVVYRLDS